MLARTDRMATSFCAVYDGSGTIWPRQPFPGNLFPLNINQNRLSMQNAWNFFELVESTDAATRVRLSNQGGWVPPAPSAFAQSPSIWYNIRNQSAQVLYRRGLSLHQQACPSINWTPQRLLGIPSSPLTDVYPGPTHCLS